MVSLYLYLNAALYFGFSLWCTVRPEQTSTFLGLSFTSPKGLAEYTAVYGGLEAGLGAFYLYAALQQTHVPAVLAFSTFLYGGLVLFRGFVLLTSSGPFETAYGVFIFEILLFAWAAYLWSNIGA